MAEYQLTAGNSVIRTLDGAVIPNDPDNKDWRQYQKWFADGNVPDPYVKPQKVTISTTDFVTSFTNAEYLKLEQRRSADIDAARVGNAKNWDVVISDVIVNITNQKAQALKASLVADGTLTQTRADEIFSGGI